MAWRRFGYLYKSKNENFVMMLYWPATGVNNESGEKCINLVVGWIQRVFLDNKIQILQRN